MRNNFSIVDGEGIESLVAHGVFDNQLSQVAITGQSPNDNCVYVEGEHGDLICGRGIDPVALTAFAGLFFVAAIGVRLNRNSKIRRPNITQP